MIIRNADVSLVNSPDLPDIFWDIETAGRVCYKSEDKMTETSRIKFIKGIIARGHEAVLEHGTFYFSLNEATFRDFMFTVQMLMVEGWICHFKFTMNKNQPCNYHVSGNVRNWREFIGRCRLVPEYMESFITAYPTLFPEYQTGVVYRSIYDGPSKFWQIGPGELNEDEFRIHYRQMVRFICDRGVSHELVRHRAASFCQESTRYCNYSKEQFGEEITVIRPSYFEDENSLEYRSWYKACEACESRYFDLIIEGCSPQQARAVLPNSLKTEVIMTCSLAEWDEFLKLRTSPAAHPQMREVAWMLQDALRDRYPKLYGKEVEEDEP